MNIFDIDPQRFLTWLKERHTCVWRWGRDHVTWIRPLVIALGVCVLLVDISGTPLALFSLKRVERSESRFHAGVIAARLDDCLEAESLRAQNRARVAKEKGELAQNLALFHIKRTPAVDKKARENFAAQLAQNRRKDCYAYAHRAQ